MRGWTVTVFNRGVSGQAPVGVEEVRGDRTVSTDLDVLSGREWDAVVDTWIGAPRAVAESARLLANSVGHYTYVSSRSVYRPPLVAGITEDAQVKQAERDVGTGATMDEGVLKAGAEGAVRRHVRGDRVLVARAGLVLGPHEDVGRLPWWLRRMARGGDVVAPGPPSLTVQCVDVRDLAGWLLDAAQRGLVDTFNALSRPGHATMATLLEGCRRVTGSGARLRWLEPEAILAAGVLPWSQLPIWVPPGHPLRPLHETNTDRAAAAGLRCRPIEQTVVDTWQWMRTTDDLDVTRWADPNLGLSPTAETMLIRAMDRNVPA
jgi:hypothetical protein